MKSTGDEKRNNYHAYKLQGKPRINSERLNACDFVCETVSGAKRSYTLSGDPWVTFWTWFGNVYLHPDEIKSGVSCDDAHFIVSNICEQPTQCFGRLNYSGV